MMEPSAAMNFLGWATDGSGSDVKKVFNRILF